jgi:hypothetical protein
MKADSLKQIREADAKIVSLEAHRTELVKQRTPLGIDQVSQARLIDRELEEIAGKISFLKDVKDRDQQQVAEWQKGGTRAVPLVKQGTESYERARSIVDSIAKHQEEVAGLLGKLDEENTNMSTVAQHFRDLTGEELNLPFPVVCYLGMAFAAPNIPRIQGYDAWKFVSETEMKEGHERLKAEQLKRHEERIKIAEAHAPDCPNCARANRQTKMIVARAEGRADSPGESLYRGSWHFRCPKCGNMLTQAIAETK